MSILSGNPLDQASNGDICDPRRHHIDPRQQAYCPNCGTRELAEYQQSKGDVDLEAKLDEWERFYNFARPHGAFNGKTPYEALRDKL